MTINASGCLLMSIETKRMLMQLRKPDRRNKSYWGFWGGGHHKNEKPIQAINRELSEEIGFLPDIIKYYPLHKMTSNDRSFEYNTFIVTVAEEFVPILNRESHGYAWIDYNRYLTPLHPGAKMVLQNPRILSKVKTVVNQF